MGDLDHDAPAAGHDIIVIGASSGGVAALAEVIGALPAKLPASIFVVLHVSPDSPSLLPGILDRASALEVAAAAHRAPIERGKVYIAPPDHHVIVESGRVVLSRGPRENRVRPAIDVLFRSAAVSYGARVVGVVLTGMLDDGSAGLAAIKACGGIAVVQDPRDAEHGGMPSAALRAVEPDHVVSLERLAGLLVTLAFTPPGPAPPVPEELALEVAIAREAEAPSGARSAHLKGGGATFVCPECGGGLRALGPDELLRFRCHLGHAFSAGALLSGQHSQLLQTLSTALRMLDERADLLATLVAREEHLRRRRSAASYAARAEETHAQAERVQELIRRLIDSWDA
jgi:two-component system, chemotaxis family, protein-glutamate methylesterase/glutaminase